LEVPNLEGQRREQTEIWEGSREGPLEVMPGKAGDTFTDRQHHESWAWWCIPAIPALRALRQEEASLGYIVRLRPTWTPQQALVSQ
jgi:hypothetical protein